LVAQNIHSNTLNIARGFTTSPGEMVAAPEES
jgi:hypothetical protein